VVSIPGQQSTLMDIHTIGLANARGCQVTDGGREDYALAKWHSLVNAARLSAQER